jgi:NAD(P)H-nitrite reductase large subunit
MGIAESNNPALTSNSHSAPGDKGNTDYRKYFFKEHRLVGAVFIGSPKGRKRMVEMIRTGTICKTPGEREALFDVR